MFIITKTFTDDEGHLFTKVNPKQYSTPGEAYDAMREDYLNELKSRGLEDNGSSNDDGESCPGGYVTQTWLVDEDGEFIKAETNCDEVTHSPDTEDLFECSKCGAEVPAKYVYSE